MEPILMVNPADCNGCRLCELACSLRNEGEFNPARSRIRVVAFHEDFVYIPMTCLHCDQAACVDACPTGACARGSDQTVSIAAGSCIGCKMCLMACQFGAISYRAGKAVKCDLCQGSPDCVRFCPAGAIAHASPADLALRRMRAKAAAMRTSA